MQPTLKSAKARLETHAGEFPHLAAELFQQLIIHLYLISTPSLPSFHLPLLIVLFTPFIARLKRATFNQMFFLCQLYSIIKTLHFDNLNIHVVPSLHKRAYLSLQLAVDLAIFTFWCVDPRTETRSGMSTPKYTHLLCFIEGSAARRNTPVWAPGRQLGNHILASHFRTKTKKLIISLKNMGNITYLGSCWGPHEAGLQSESRQGQLFEGFCISSPAVTQHLTRGPPWASYIEVKISTSGCPLRWNPSQNRR